ncbi:flavin reductase family protein [Psychrobacter sp. B38]|uniref:flavin reductase family protein n=1 Tax=Psychrobacter sp. B38 TaxID=3143538 RepID=UPI00320F24AD
MHKTIAPKVLYFGTPVALIGTLNEDGTANLAPISSIWWVNQSCMIGMSSKSKTVGNLLRERECSVNLPSEDLVGSVDQLALLTGSHPVPEAKKNMGYKYESDKFRTAGLTPDSAKTISASLVKECPVQLEGRVVNVHSFEGSTSILAIEIHIELAHIDEKILVDGKENYIDPEKWKPIIMNFCEFFGLSGNIHPSKLAKPFMAQEYG